MKIDELLDKYFEGETSCEEERELRRFFTEEEVPEHLQTYRPLFAYLNREATSMAEPTEEKSVQQNRQRKYPHSGSLSVSIAHSMLSAALPPDCSCFSG